MNQALFRAALAREQKRAVRFEQSFGLVLVSLAGATRPELQWAQVLEALSASRRDADVIGWFEEGAVIGLIRSHVDLDPHQTGASLEATVRRDMERFLRAGVSPGWRFQSHVCSAHAEFPHEGLELAPALEPSRARAAASATWCTARRSGRSTLSAARRSSCCARRSCSIIAVLVKWTSKGPVFFRQERVGQHARPFRMLKFRTMRVDAGHEIHQQYVTQYIQGQAASNAASGGAPAVFKLVGDPRVTRLGSFLRRSSLDEVPQFWNVLKGEMSLVGPRPPLPYEVKCYKPWHLRRVLDAKPGITGLWQVTGRSRTTFDEMVRLDIRYARTARSGSI